jgi:hypothetical protein
MHLFQLATKLNSHNTYDTVIHNEIWHINWYMNIGISNWHNWSYNTKKMKFLTLLQFFTRLLSSKHLKLFITYLVGRNGTIWKTCFSAPRNVKKENQLKPNTKCVTDFYWHLGLRVCRIILVIMMWAHKSQSFTLI